MKLGNSSILTFICHLDFDIGHQQPCNLMKNLFINILNFFLSLKTALWFLGFLLLFLFAGALIMPGRPEFELLHSVPVFEWIRKQHVGITWWLWGVIFVLSILAINTLFCSIESIIKKRSLTPVKSKSLFGVKVCAIYTLPYIDSELCGFVVSI